MIRTYVEHIYELGSSPERKPEVLNYWPAMHRNLLGMCINCKPDKEI